jgi:hypothetical protein
MRESSEEKSEQKQSSVLHLRIAYEDGKRWNGLLGVWRKKEWLCGKKSET